MLKVTSDGRSCRSFLESNVDLNGGSQSSDIQEPGWSGIGLHIIDAY